MSRLPIPGSDQGSWGDILNDFLDQAHNPDGSLKDSAVKKAGDFYIKPATGIPATDLDAATQNKLAQTVTGSSGYQKPAGGIPASDLSSPVQGSLTKADSAVQSVNSKSGASVALTASDVGAIPISDVLAKGDLLAGTGVGAVSNLGVGTDGQVLTADSSTSTGLSWTTVAGTPDASTTSKGIIQLAGDLSGTASAPTVPGLATKVSSVTAADSTIAVAGTATSPTVKVGTITNTNLTDGTITAAKLDSTVNSYLADAQTAVQSVNGKTGQAVSLAYSDVGAAQGLSPTSVKTANYSASAGDFVPVDISGGNVIVGLPSAPADKTRVGIKVVKISGTQGSTTCTVNRSGSDVFNITGGSTSLTLSALYQGVLLQYQATGGIWYVATADTPLGQAGGAAQLDSTGKLTTAQIPTSVVTDSSGTGGSLPVREVVGGPLLRNLIVVGSSYGRAEGAGASAVKHRYSLAVARRFGAAEHNVAVNGAYMSYPHKGASGDGGWADIFQLALPWRTTAPYVAGIDSAIISSGINDCGLYGSANMQPWIDATRAVLCRLRAGAVFEDTDSSVAYGGTWSQNNGTTNNSGSSNHVTTHVGDTVTITVPSDFPGGEIDLGFVLSNGNVSNASIKVDGVTTDTFAYGSSYVSAGGTYLGVVRRLTGLASGSHTIVVTTTTGTTALNFDYWSIVSVAPPPIVMQLWARLTSYTGLAATLSDADIVTLNGIITSLAAEFTDGLVGTFAIDNLMAKSAANFAADGLHPNDHGHQMIAGAAAQALMAIIPPGERPAGNTPMWHQIGQVNEPAFTNSWVNAGISGYPGAGFRSDRNRVSLRGMIKSGAAGTSAFTLPDGYRPATNLIVPALLNSGSVATTSVVVGSDGTVTPIGSGTTYTSINGISFDVA